MIIIQNTHRTKNSLEKYNYHKMKVSKRLEQNRRNTNDQYSWWYVNLIGNQKNSNQIYTKNHWIVFKLKSIEQSVSEDIEQMQHLHIAGGNVSWCHHGENNLH